MQIAPSPGLAVLIGGAGFIGSAVAESLVRAGWQLRIASRNLLRRRFIRSQCKEHAVGLARADLAAPASVAAAVRSADVVVNLVGILDERGGQSFAGIQAQGAGVAAQAAAAAGARAFVHLSAIGADPASPSAYGRTKAQGESAVLAAFPRAAVVRPSLVFGAEDGFTRRFASLIASAPVIPVIAAETRFQPVHVKDVGMAVHAIIAADRSGVHELGGPEVLGMRQIIRFIADETGNGAKPLFDMPDFAARLLAGLGFLPGAPLTPDQYLMLKRDNIVSGAHPGLPDLGIAPVSLQAVAGQWLARYRAGGRFAA
jgi:NADH dehydrogenase